MKKFLAITAIMIFTFAYANDNTFGVDNIYLISALYFLGLIGIIILFVSSKQLKKMENLYKNMLEKQKEMDKGQTSLLEDMSKKIYEITKEAIENRDNIIRKSREKSLETILSGVINAENALLDRTNDLIGFLRLKSKKVEIKSGKFNINNVLNEVSGSVCRRFKGSRSELIFDIDKDVPRYFVGDSLHLEQILTNLLDYSLANTLEGEVRLDISIFNSFKDKTQLQFQISDNSEGISEEQLEKIFVPYYDEETNEYVRLGLFISSQLISLMGGEIAVQSTVGKGTSFTFSIPIQVFDPNEKRKYHLPSKSMTSKNILIVDSNYNSALVIKKMFSYFKHNVKVIPKDQFMMKKYDLSGYDMLLLDESIFGSKIRKHLKLQNYIYRLFDAREQKQTCRKIHRWRTDETA